MFDRGYGPVAVLALGLMWLVLVGAVVALVVWFVARSGRRPMTEGHRSAALGAPYAPGTAAGPSSGPGPLAILDERLARGEIDVETYRALRAELTQSSHTPSAPPPTQGSS